MSAITSSDDILASLVHRVQSYSLRGARIDLAEVRLSQKVLRPFSTPEALVRALARGTPSLPTRSAIVAALLIEAKAGYRSMLTVLLHGRIEAIADSVRHLADHFEDVEALEAVVVEAVLTEASKLPGSRITGDIDGELIRAVQARVEERVRRHQPKRPPVAFMCLESRSPAC